MSILLLAIFNEHVPRFQGSAEPRTIQSIGVSFHFEEAVVKLGGAGPREYLSELS